MSRKLLLLAATAAVLSGAATFAKAADILEPQVIDLPEPVMNVAAPAKGGWYIRGDVGYSKNTMSDVDYVTAGIANFGLPNAKGILGTGVLKGTLSDSYSFGAGIGYDTGNYLRVDLTADYFSKANFKGSSTGQCPGNPTFSCTTTDSATYETLSLMANAYVDLGKYHGFTPYVGAGIGGTQVKWGELSNKYADPAYSGFDETHNGNTSWRYTYALMAGASYDVTDCVALDAGYRYRHIAGGKMFNIGNGAAASAPAGSSSTGPGHDKGIKSHEVRVGARYKFGGCGTAKIADYQPDYQPVYK